MDAVNNVARADAVARVRSCVLSRLTFVELSACTAALVGDSVWLQARSNLDLEASLGVEVYMLHEERPGGGQHCRNATRGCDPLRVPQVQSATS